MTIDENKIANADARKGIISVEQVGRTEHVRLAANTTHTPPLQLQEDGLVHFRWRLRDDENQPGEVVKDTIVFPGDAIFDMARAARAMLCGRLSGPLGLMPLCRSPSQGRGSSA